jgi:hypothetical protein
VEVKTYIVVFWVMVPYSLVDGYQCVFKINAGGSIFHRNAGNGLPKKNGSHNTATYLMNRLRMFVNGVLGKALGSRPCK